MGTAQQKTTATTAEKTKISAGVKVILYGC